MKKYYYYNPIENELHSTDENWCPDGSGFMVEFKGDYKHYLKNKEKYSLVGTVFMQEAETLGENEI